MHGKRYLLNNNLKGVRANKFAITPFLQDYFIAEIAKATAPASPALSPNPGATI